VVNSQKSRALLGWAGETSFDYAQGRLCPYVAVYPPSVFQSKNEPEGNGKGRRRWSSFQVIYEMSLAVSDLVLERGNGARGKGAAFEPPCLAHRLEALRGLTQLLKEAVFGLLHAPGGCGIAHHSCDTFECGDMEART